MTNRTKSDVIEIVKCMETLYNNNGIRKKKVKLKYININILDLILLSISINNLHTKKIKKILEKSITFIEYDNLDKFVDKKIIVNNDKVLLKTALKTNPNNKIYINIEKIFKIIKEVKLKIDNNITNELYRLLFSNHTSYVILLGINYKIKGNLKL